MVKNPSWLFIFATEDLNSGQHQLAARAGLEPGTLEFQARRPNHTWGMMNYCGGRFQLTNVTKCRL